MPTERNTVPSPWRKAAILVSILDSASADAILEKMTPEQATRVRNMVMSLDDVGPDEQEQVLREFVLAGGRGEVANGMDGVELDISKEAMSAANTPPHNSQPVPRKHFAALHDARPDSLARHLSRQHPQVAAVVLAHLEPQLAANVLKRMTAEIQGDVLRRVADMGATDPESIRDIEAELTLLLGDELDSRRNREHGVSTLQTILQAAGEDRGQLMRSLARIDAELCAMVQEQPTSVTGSPQIKTMKLRPVPRTIAMPSRPSSADTSRFESQRVDTLSRSNSTGVPGNAETEMLKATAHQDRDSHDLPSVKSVDLSVVAFEDLIGLDQEDWALLIRSSERNVVLLALAGASDSLINRMVKHLGPSEERSFRRRLESIGPVRLSDIEQAQLRIAHTAARLASEGQIALPEPKRFAAAA